ncbi:type II secretion system major pseudopilin GspG [bacterium]|nr:type II secretion system major pseudopilin GspG [bacterium]
MIRHNNRGRRGFTFLEIMFVVVIIGVLLAIVGPRLAGKSKKARIQAAKTQIHNIKLGLSQFEMHLGRFPDTNEGLEALFEEPSDAPEGMWEGPYLDADSVPKDQWGHEFRYRAPGEHSKDYDLWSDGPDGQEGTDDDVTSWTKKE